MNGYTDFTGALNVTVGANNYNITLTVNTLSGTVLSSMGGNVGAGAIVTIGGVSGTTDSNGQYTVYAVPSGNGQNLLARRQITRIILATVNITDGNNSYNFTMTANPGTVTGYGLFFGRRSGCYRRERHDRRSFRHYEFKRHLYPQQRSCRTEYDRKRIKNGIFSLFRNNERRKRRNYESSI